MTYLAVPIAARNLEEAEHLVHRALTAGAEMLELRADYLDDLTTDVMEVLIAETKAVGQGVPVIVTCRDKQEGGARQWPIDLRCAVLQRAVQCGAHLVDCEYVTFLKGNADDLEVAIDDAPDTRLILSAHSFDGPFYDGLAAYFKKISAQRADIIKLVYTAKHINDCFEAFDLLHKADKDVIAFCMGPAGLISRILAKKLGSFITFASLDDKTATAPGQLKVEDFKGLYRYKSIQEDTELYGVIGSPVGHSLSPHIHNACFAAAGLNKLYLPLLVEGGKKEFEHFVDNCRSRPWLHFRGFSVTIPHKHNAIEYVQAKRGYIEPLAGKIGAANTLMVDESGKVSAYNTDYAGALDAITMALDIERADLRGMPVAVIGAGGVSRAIVAGLSEVGARVTIYNRTIAKAEGLAGEFECESAGLGDLPGLNAEILINCTSVGMHPEVGDSPVPREVLTNEMMVFDTVYNPAQTLLLKQAGDVGAKTVDGVSMFINQAAAQFKLFTGRRADMELMRRVVCDCLSAC